MGFSDIVHLVIIHRLYITNTSDLHRDERRNKKNKCLPWVAWIRVGIIIVEQPALELRKTWTIEKMQGAGYLKSHESIRSDKSNPHPLSHSAALLRMRLRAL